MKIVLVLPSEPGYSETFFPSKIKGLQENGHTVELHVGSKTGELDFCRVVQSPRANHGMIRLVFAMFWQFVRLLPHLGTVIRYCRLLRKKGFRFRESVERIYLNAKLLRSRADWIHFGFATQARGREFVAKSIGAKCAVSFRGYDIGIYPLKHPGCYKNLLRQVDKVHYLSEDLWKKALNFGFSADTSRMKIPPAIDVQKFKAKNELNRLVNPDDSIKVLTVGRLHWKKGYLYTVEAIAKLIQDGFNIEYTIVGTGDDYERVAYRAYQLGILERVKFLWKVHHDKLPDIYQEHDIYIQYSVQEGFCNAVLEAQAMGKFVVVSDAEGLPENVLNGKTGFVVPKLRPDLLAEELIKTINLPEVKQKEIKQAAVERVREKFYLNHQKKLFHQFYTEEI